MLRMSVDLRQACSSLRTEPAMRIFGSYDAVVAIIQVLLEHDVAIP